MILRQEEHLLRSEVVVRVITGIGQRVGMLYLTTTRIVFEERPSRGLFQTEPSRTTLDVPIAHVSNVIVDQPTFGIGRPMLHVELSGRDGFVFKTVSASDWAGWITALRREYRSQPDSRPEPLKALEQAHRPAQSGIAPYVAPVVVNVQTPAAAPPRSFLHCRYCGALTPAGSGIGIAKCSGCGAAL